MLPGCCTVGIGIGNASSSCLATPAPAPVVRGHPGVGKTALLADVAARAEGMQVMRTQGIESESPLPFAALQRLLRPVMRHVEHLPVRQATALRAGRNG